MVPVIKLTEDMHIARAMLMGMRYHHGNGVPFYYTNTPDGVPDMCSFIDATTLEPMVNVEQTPSRDWGTIRQRARGLKPW